MDSKGCFLIAPAIDVLVAALSYLHMNPTDAHLAMLVLVSEFEF